MDLVHAKMTLRWPCKISQEHWRSRNYASLFMTVIVIIAA